MTTHINVTSPFWEGYSYFRFATGVKDRRSELLAEANKDHLPEGSVFVSGAPNVGEVLTIISTLSDADGLLNPTYNWYADGELIENATADSLVVSEAFDAKILSASVSYTDATQHRMVVYSEPTPAVSKFTRPRVANAWIAGASVEGEILTVGKVIILPDEVGPLEYKWYVNSAEVSGEITDSFLLTQGHVGARVKASISYLDYKGEIATVYTAQTGPVDNINDEPIGSVFVLGTAAMYQTLVANPVLSDQDGLGDFKYYWYMDGDYISGANMPQLGLNKSHVGKRIKVLVKYTDELGALEAVYSDETDPVLPTNTAPTGAIYITGDLVEGSTLSSTNDVADLDGMFSMTHKWYAGGEEIIGVSTNSLNLSSAYRGKTISVSLVYTDGLGFIETVTSAPTAPVQKAKSKLRQKGVRLFDAVINPNSLPGQNNNNLVYKKEYDDLVFTMEDNTPFRNTENGWCLRTDNRYSRGTIGSTDTATQVDTSASGYIIANKVNKDRIASTNQTFELSYNVWLGDTFSTSTSNDYNDFLFRRLGTDITNYNSIPTTKKAPYADLYIDTSAVVTVKFALYPGMTEMTKQFNMSDLRFREWQKVSFKRMSNGQLILAYGDIVISNNLVYVGDIDMNEMVIGGNGFATPNYWGSRMIYDCSLVINDTLKSRTIIGRDFYKDLADTNGIVMFPKTTTSLYAYPYAPNNASYIDSSHTDDICAQVSQNTKTIPSIVRRDENVIWSNAFEMEFYYLLQNKLATQILLTSYPTTSVAAADKKYHTVIKHTNAAGLTTSPKPDSKLVLTGFGKSADTIISTSDRYCEWTRVKLVGRGNAIDVYLNTPGDLSDSGMVLKTTIVPDDVNYSLKYPVRELMGSNSTSTAGSALSGPILMHKLKLSINGTPRYELFSKSAWDHDASGNDNELIGTTAGAPSDVGVFSENQTTEGQRVSDICVGRQDHATLASEGRSIHKYAGSTSLKTKTGAVFGNFKDRVELVEYFSITSVVAEEVVLSFMKSATGAAKLIVSTTAKDANNKSYLKVQTSDQSTVTTMRIKPGVFYRLRVVIDPKTASKSEVSFYISESVDLIYDDYERTFPIEVLAATLPSNHVTYTATGNEYYTVAANLGFFHRLTCTIVNTIVSDVVVPVKGGFLRDLVSNVYIVPVDDITASHETVLVGPIICYPEENVTGSFSSISAGVSSSVAIPFVDLSTPIYGDVNIYYSVRVIPGSDGLYLPFVPYGSSVALLNNANPAAFDAGVSNDIVTDYLAIGRRVDILMSRVGSTWKIYELTDNAPNLLVTYPGLPDELTSIRYHFDNIGALVVGDFRITDPAGTELLSLDFEKLGIYDNTGNTNILTRNCKVWVDTNNLYSGSSPDKHWMKFSASSWPLDGLIYSAASRLPAATSLSLTDNRVASLYGNYILSFEAVVLNIDTVATLASYSTYCRINAHPDGTISVFGQILPFARFVRGVKFALELRRNAETGIMTVYMDGVYSDTVDLTVTGAFMSTINSPNVNYIRTYAANSLSASTVNKGWTFGSPTLTNVGDGEGSLIGLMRYHRLTMCLEV